MILTVDIGNSNILLGWFEGARLVRTVRIQTHGRALHSLRTTNYAQRTTHIVIASVVPEATQNFKKKCRKDFPRAKITVLNYKNISGIKVAVKKPAQVGIDRLINACYAYQKYKTDLVVIDMGTATTFDCVINGKFIGGIIAPGLKIMRDALHEKTALLPQAPLLPPRRLIGKDTVAALQTGIFTGYVALVEGLIARLKKESKKKLFVVATGGLAGLIQKQTKCINKIDKNLTLQGIKFVYENSCG